MADDSEMRIEALKKAYAEIILNTSKEAATRVMAAERKALCFHHDLVSLKEESLTMFLRLKENFNSKITEAEAKSYNQEMKIEELEAQLSEAEGIIVDLRDELKQLHEKLETMRHNQKQSLSGHILGVVQPAHECVLQENALNSSPLVISPVSNGKFIPVDCERNVAILHPTAQINKCSNPSSNGLSSKSDLGQLHTGKYDITSIIMENRETELYKNGCTQRIRAFERNLSNVNLPSSSEDHQHTINVQPETKQEDSGNSSQYPVTERMENGHQNDLAYTKTVQKRNKKRGKSSDELNRDSGKSLKTSSKASAAVSCSEAHLKTVNISVTKDPFSVFSSESEKKNVKVISNASEQQLVHDCTRDKDQTIRSLRRSARKSSRYKEAISALKRPYHKKCIKSSQNSFPFQCRAPSIDVTFKNPMEETEKGSENTEFYESLSDELGTSCEIKYECNDFVTGGKPDWCKEGDAAKTREGLGEKSYHVSDDTVLLNAQLFDVPISEGFGSTQSQSQTQNQSGNERQLKFTFYRKRRKNVLGKLDENIVHDKSTVKKEVEKPTIVPMLENRSLEDEVNVDGGGVMQISHQLVLE